MTEFCTLAHCHMVLVSPFFFYINEGHFISIVFIILQQKKYNKDSRVKNRLLGFRLNIGCSQWWYL
ncbi:transmembrane protein, putative [Medicago truncatula]|uniref:Transmembrane protein, putative n=1 Tax=Medicago truncatula TaxID=3880 RepID=A0A072VJ93_MEDTR|nr:transmembrane protein, putative [Medicago truncatula]